MGWHIASVGGAGRNGGRRDVVRAAKALTAAFCLWLVALSVTPAAAATLQVGAVFSTAQTASQSFLRFHNTGSSAGTVTVTLQD